MGPLSGVRIVELAGIGPSPFAAMLLADMGATVVRVDRPSPGDRGIARPLRYNLLLRSRQTIELDLKTEAGREIVLHLVSKADGLIEGFRPGVTEKLGLGPDDCLARNPRLVYARMTGWGQDGPLAQAAGHDLNYIALTGVLDMIGRKGQPPTIPLNLVGDFGGGGMYLALGMLAALLEAKSSGHGQVVDAAIVDGTASLATTIFGMHQAGMLAERGDNVLDGGAPYYNVYRCKDGKYISIGPIEPRFHAQLCSLLGLSEETLGAQDDRQSWPRAQRKFEEVFRERTRDQWCELLEGTDACFAPVLDADEAASHPHLKARQTFVEVDGVTQPAPAPRFSRTTTQLPRTPQAASEDTLRQTLADWLGEGAASQWISQLKQS